MLADPRAQRFVVNFVGQWLRLRELDDFPSQDPEWDADLRTAFRHETELLFADSLREKRDVVSLLDADYTYLNERLAAHYGLAGVHDSYMRRVSLPPDSPRRGLLGQGSLLTITSAPNRTSPVVRGAWIVQNLLGAAVPSPPPGAAADLAKEAVAKTNLVGDTVRERLEMHRANPTLRCVSRDHGSGRARARELRSRRPLARARGRPRGECRDPADRRHANLGRGGPAPRAPGALRRVRRGADRAAHDLRVRARARLLRPPRRAPSRARRDGARPLACRARSSDRRERLRSRSA